ncbi:MAG: hypothetical protein IT497_09495 [Ottowia sp.]|nr:hypothetical protein [Ottowia sp.]
MKHNLAALKTLIPLTLCIVTLVGKVVQAHPFPENTARAQKHIAPTRVKREFDGPPWPPLYDGQTQEQTVAPAPENCTFLGITLDTCWWKKLIGC